MDTDGEDTDSISQHYSYWAQHVSSVIVVSFFNWQFIGGIKESSEEGS